MSSIRRGLTKIFTAPIAENNIVSDSEKAAGSKNMEHLKLAIMFHLNFHFKNDIYSVSRKMIGSSGCCRSCS